MSTNPQGGGKRKETVAMDPPAEGGHPALHWFLMDIYIYIYICVYTVLL